MRMGQTARYTAEFYTTARGDCPVDIFLDELHPKHRAKIEKFIEILEEKGPNLPRPYADVIQGPVRELRVKFGNMNYRLFYFFHEKRIILTHGIVKKTGPVPTEEIARTMRYRVDWLQRST